MSVGQAAIVTGGAQGIGLCTVRSLLQAGVKVTVLDISEDILTQTCTELGKEFPPDSILPFQCDVTNKEQFAKSFLVTKEKFGSVDILVNNAGISGIDEWEKVLNVNLHAPMFGTYTAVEHMSPQHGGKGGVIINVASMAAFCPIPGGGPYTASKAGLVGFTRSMEILNPMAGVRINCVCPAIADTPLVRNGLQIKDPDKQEVIKFMLHSIEKQGGFLSPESIAEGIMKLITDTSLNGKVMKISPRRGHYFEEYPSYEEFVANA